MKDGMTAAALRSRYAAETAEGAGYVWADRVQILEDGKAKKSGGNKAVLALVLALVLTLAASAVFLLTLGRGAGTEDAGEKPAASVKKKEKKEETEAADDEHPEREDVFDENGVQTGYYLYEYDEEGRCTAEEEYGMDDVSKRRWEYTYSADGSETETRFYWQGEYTFRWVDFYNENGVRTEQRSYAVDDALTDISYCGADGEFIRREIYQGAAGQEIKWLEEELDERGFAAKRIYFTESGEVEYTHVLECDERGLEVRDICYKSDGSFFYELRCTYNEDGFILREESYDEDGVMEDYSVWEYEPDGRTIARYSYDAADTLTSYDDYVYAEDGSYEIIHCGPDGSEFSRTKFDADGFYIG